MEYKNKRQSSRILIDDVFLALIIWMIFILRRNIYDLLIVRELFHPSCVFALIPHALIAFSILYMGIRIGLIGTPKAVFTTRGIPHFYILLATTVLCTVFWKPIGYTFDIVNFHLNRDLYQDYVESPADSSHSRNVLRVGERRDIVMIFYAPHTSYCYFPDAQNMSRRGKKAIPYAAFIEVSLEGNWYICYG